MTKCNQFCCLLIWKGGEGILFSLGKHESALNALRNLKYCVESLSIPQDFFPFFDECLFFFFFHDYGTVVNEADKEKKTDFNLFSWLHKLWI